MRSPYSQCFRESTHPVSSVTLVGVEQDTGVSGLVRSREVEIASRNVATATSDRDLDANWRLKVLSSFFCSPYLA